MRIIAGLYRGRRLKTLPGLELRPTGDRLRETLFNVLRSGVEGSVFVDAYAGSGAVGLEALSRGARQVFFLEQNAAATAVIQENLAALAVSDNAQVIRASVRKGLRLLEERGVRADYCFLDPPYAARHEYVTSLRCLSQGQLMDPEGLIIVEHRRKEAMEEKAGEWICTRLLRQGSSALAFYRVASENSQSVMCEG